MSGSVIPEYYGHKHEPTFPVLDKESNEDCRICGNRIWGPAYNCVNCKLWMHRSCAKLPLQMQHPFHPPHSLRFLPKAPRKNFYSDDRYVCFACGDRLGDYSYHCSTCNFSLDVKCAALTLQQVAVEQLIEHSPHPHPLILCSKSKRYDVYKFCCSYCDLPLEDTRFLVCLDCHFTLHKWCSEFPQELDHPMHDHPVTMTMSNSRNNSRCAVCWKYNDTRINFECTPCDLALCFRCVRLIPVKICHDLDLRIQNFNHPHPLVALENPANFPFKCYLCKLPISYTIFVCFECHMLFHISCLLNLPKQITYHPFHPQHPIKLHDDLTQCTSKFFCWLCRQEQIKIIHYKCLDCTFSIHFNCAFPKPPIVKIQIHPHPLVYLTSPSTGFRSFRCNACKRKCKSTFFMCMDMECMFFLHMHCFPNLPSTVRDAHHRHPLKFTTLPIKDHPDEDDNAIFYCDSCEKMRNLSDPSYYCIDCVECPYVAHMHCVASEVVRFLQDKEQEEVNLESESNDNASTKQAKNEKIELLE